MIYVALYLMVTAAVAFYAGVRWERNRPLQKIPEGLLELSSVMPEEPVDNVSVRTIRVNGKVASQVIRVVYKT